MTCPPDCNEHKGCIAGREAARIVSNAGFYTDLERRYGEEIAELRRENERLRELLRALVDVAPDCVPQQNCWWIRITDTYAYKQAIAALGHKSEETKT